MDDQIDVALRVGAVFELRSPGCGTSSTAR